MFTRCCRLNEASIKGELKAAILKNVTFAVFTAKNAETKVTLGIDWWQKGYKKGPVF